MVLANTMHAQRRCMPHYQRPAEIVRPLSARFHRCSFAYIQPDCDQIARRVTSACACIPPQQEPGDVTSSKSSRPLRLTTERDGLPNSTSLPQPERPSHPAALLSDDSTQPTELYQNSTSSPLPYNNSHPSLASPEAISDDNQPSLASLPPPPPNAIHSSPAPDSSEANTKHESPSQSPIPASGNTTPLPATPDATSDATSAHDTPTSEPSVDTSPSSISPFWDTFSISFFKAIVYFLAPLVKDMEVANSEEEEAALDVKRAEDLSKLGVNETPNEVFNELLRLGFFLRFLTVGAVFYGTQALGHYNSAECVRATLGLTAGYLIAPFSKIEPLTSIVKRQFDVKAKVYSADEVRDALNSVGMTLLVLLIVPRVTQGWDLTTDLQVVVPLMAGWALSDVADDLAVALFLLRK